MSDFSLVKEHFAVIPAIKKEDAIIHSKDE